MEQASKHARRLLKSLELSPGQRQAAKKDGLDGLRRELDTFLSRFSTSPGQRAARGERPDPRHESVAILRRRMEQEGPVPSGQIPEDPNAAEPPAHVQKGTERRTAP